METSEQSEERPELLWHYTSAQGLLGIVGTRKLFATELHYLNDPEEMRNGLELLAQTHSAIESCDLDQADASKVARELKDFGVTDGLEDPKVVKGHLWKIGRMIQELENRFVFVASFSAEDVLSQWRAYGMYAIGFSTDELVSQLPKSWCLRRCLYDQEAKNRLAPQQILSSLLGSLGREGDALLLGELAALAAASKQDGYSEELEWRVISEPWAPTSSGTLYRSREEAILPYRELCVGDSIRKVMTGPKLDFEATKRALQPRLGKSVEITGSRTSLR